MYTHWKKGENQSYRKHILGIAKFLHVPVSFFDDEYDDGSHEAGQHWLMSDKLSEEEVDLILTLRRAGDESIHTLLAFIKQLTHHDRLT